MTPSPESYDAPDLGRYGHIIWSARRMIGVVTTIAAILSAILAFTLPSVYEAVTTVIPIRPVGSSGALGSLSASLEEFGVRPPSAGDQAPTYPEIVRSRRLLEQLLPMRFTSGAGASSPPLIDIIEPRGRGAKRVEAALRTLRGDIDTYLDRRTGILTIKVRSRRPHIAAGIANALTIMLQEFTLRSMAYEASENRKFIEGRLGETEASLSRAEEELSTFRQRNLRIGNSPRLQLEEGRLMRALREQEEVYLTLKRQYELAKIEEHRDVPILNVLDPAVIPASRSSPRRIRMVVLGLTCGLALGIVTATLAREART